MVIALLLLSLFGGLAGAGLAVVAELGLVMGIVAYVTGGMLGTGGFLALIALRCRLQADHSPTQAATSISG